MRADLTLNIFLCTRVAGLALSYHEEDLAESGSQQTRLEMQAHLQHNYQCFHPSTGTGPISMYPFLSEIPVYTRDRPIEFTHSHHATFPGMFWACAIQHPNGGRDCEFTSACGSPAIPAARLPFHRPQPGRPSELRGTYRNARLRVIGWSFVPAIQPGLLCPFKSRQIDTAVSLVRCILYSLYVTTLSPVLFFLAHPVLIPTMDHNDPFAQGSGLSMCHRRLFGYHKGNRTNSFSIILCRC